MICRALASLRQRHPRQNGPNLAFSVAIGIGDASSHSALLERLMASWEVVLGFRLRVRGF